jgi:hypothetical protein
MDEKPDKTSAVRWSQSDEALMLDTLTDMKREGKHWGDNNPRPEAWTKCEGVLKGSEKRSGGGPKTAKSIKSRWNRVSTPSWTRCTNDNVHSSNKSTTVSRSSDACLALDGTLRRVL